MAPGFTNDDYIGGERSELIRVYPGEADLITQLARPRNRWSWKVIDLEWSLEC